MGIVIFVDYAKKTGIYSQNREEVKKQVSPDSGLDFGQLKSLQSETEDELNHDGSNAVTLDNSKSMRINEANFVHDFEKLKNGNHAIQSLKRSIVSSLKLTIVKNLKPESSVTLHCAPEQNKTQNK